MLILVFRGVFLLGILSWYSTHVWKMIDTYFKEKFDIYLQQEFKKNPRMREHVETEEKLGREIVRNKVDEEPAEKESPISPIDRQQESCQRLGDLGDEVCSMDESIVENMAAGDDTVTGSTSLLMTKGEATIDDNRSGESEVIDKKGATLTRNLVEEVLTKDASANEKSLQLALMEAEIAKEASGENVTPKTATPEADFSKVTKSQLDEPAAIIAESKQLTQKKKKKSTLRKKNSLRPKSEEANEVNEKKKKQRVKTIFLTEKDFRDAKIHGGWKDYDFMEFDDEEEDANRESPEGILVSQLPFKPRADIGKLERVTEDEFCPLTLEDEADCDEVRIWP